LLGVYRNYARVLSGLSVILTLLMFGISCGGTGLAATDINKSVSSVEVRGFVWHDVNNNNQYDGNDHGIAGCLVQVDDMGSPPNILAYTYTNGAGQYGITYDYTSGYYLRCPTLPTDCNTWNPWFINAPSADALQWFRAYTN